MANEINGSFSLSFSKENNSDNTSVSFTDDMAASPGKFESLTVSVTDSAANLSFTGITTARWGTIKNLGDTNDLILGVDNTGFVEVFRLPANTGMMFRVGTSVTLQVKCDSTETTTAQVVVYEA